MVKKIEETKLWFVRYMPQLLMVIAIVGFIASFVLTLDKIQLLKDPSFQPSCNISPLISCGSVMKTEQAEEFGFPNSLIGIVGFTMLGTIAFALLAGAKFKRWFWLTLEGGSIFGVLFIHWLMFQSIFVIGALCPYCMIAWVCAIPLFWYVSLYNLATGRITLPKRFDKAVAFVQKHHFDILLLWILTIIGVILYKFWYYWSTLI